MEKRDPLRELGNTSDNNESQENGKEPKVPEVTLSADKENGFSKVEKSDAGKSGCGKLRLSFLKTFDPLYTESAEGADVSDQTSVEPETRKNRQQLIIEDSDSDRSQVSLLPIDVSDDEAAFVDATFNAASDDDTRSEKIPENKNQELEESLLKFYTPEKFSTLSKDNKDIATPTTSFPGPSNSKSVLSVSKETVSTSSSSQNVDISNVGDSTNSENSDIKSDSPVPSKASLEVNITESLQDISTDEEPVSHLDNKEQVEDKPAGAAEELSDDTTRDISDSILSEPTHSDQSLDKDNLEKGNIEKKSNEDVLETSDSQKGLEKVPSDTADTVTSTENIQYCEEQLPEEKPKEELPGNLNKTLEEHTKEKPEVVLSEKTQEPVVEKTEEVVHPSSEVFIEKGKIETEVAKVESPKKDISVQNKTLKEHIEEKPELVLSVKTQEPVEEKTEEVVHPSSEELVEKEETETEVAEVECPKKDIPVQHETLEEHTEEKPELVLSEKTQEPVEEKTEKVVHPSSEEFIDIEKTEKEVEVESPKKDTPVQNKTLEEHTEEKPELVLSEKTQEPVEEKTEEVVHPLSEELIEKEKTEAEVAEVESPKKDIPVQKTEEEFNESLETLSPVDEKSGDITVILNTEDTVHPSSEEETDQPAEKEASQKETEKEVAEVESPKKNVPVQKTEEPNETFETSSPIDENTELIPDDTTAVINQEEDQHLDSGVESIEESYTKSPTNPVADSEGEHVCEDKEDSNLHDDGVPEDEFKVDADGQVQSDESEDTKTISEGSIQDEQIFADTSTKTEPEKIEVSEKVLEEVDNKSETESEKSASNKVAFDAELKAKMADLSEKLSEQQQENSDLKLQLNASQQAKASLELEIRQKEEVIIKTQAEALKNEQMFKQEIKQLREKLKENSKLIEKDSCKELEEQLKEAKAREAKAIAELNQRTKDDLNYQKIMEEYENTIATRFADYQKLKEEHETATRHLANIELAFSDVHQKYERTKALLEGFKANEETLSLSLQASEKTCKQHEERYESLKAHAKAQIEKSNKEILMLRDKYETDINKFKAIIKRLEIKCSSLEVSLQQKTEECAALAALCDEVTGKRV